MAVANRAVVPPPAPVLTGEVRARYTGAQRPGGFPDLELVVPVAAGAAADPTDPAQGTANYRVQWRIWLDGDSVAPEEWQTLPLVEAPTDEIIFIGPAGIVEVDVRVYAVSAYGTLSPPLLAAERLPLIGLADPPADLVLEALRRTDAAGSRSVLRATWTAEPGALYVPRYRRDEEPWTELPAQPAAFLEVAPAPAGIWRVEVRAQNAAGALSEASGAEAVVELGLADQELPQPTGVELLGPEGELLGSARTFTGRDLKVRWTSVRADALETALLGTAPDDELLEFAVVRVRDPLSLVLVREELLPISVSEWTYTYAAATQDGPLTTDPESATRSVRIEVGYKDRTGRLSAFAPIEVQWTIQLTSTPDIELLAVTEISVYEGVVAVDWSEEDYGTPAVVDFIEFESPGGDLLLHCEEQHDSVSVTVVDALAVTYRGKTIFDGDVIQGIDQTTLSFINDGGDVVSFRGCYYSATFLIPDSIEGETYAFELSAERERADPGDAVDGTSRRRLITIQAIKR